MSDKHLTTTDLQHGVWLRFKQELEERLAACRRRNDNVSLDATETTALRGQIKELKFWLDRDKPEPVINTPTTP